MDAFEGFSDISPDNDQGVLKKVIKEGSGEARPMKGATVYVHYTGTLCGGDKDGEKFDSSRDRNERFSFVLDEGSVIKAWDIGVATMKRNEVCELICKPAYAYGEKATGSIPANSTLKFEIELFDWKGKDVSPNKDGSIIQTMIAVGSGFESPKDCVLVKVSIKGTFEERVFDERDLEFEIGDGASSHLVPGIELAVRKMKKAERSVFELAPSQAFGKAGNQEWNIPGNATVFYEILLKDFEKIKESYSIDSTQEKLEYAQKFKTRATERFQNANVAYASKLYERAISYVEYDTDFKDDEKEQRNNLLLSLRLNLALCFLKMADSARTIEECDKALELDRNSEKGLYRKGQALMMKGDFEEARDIFVAVLKLNPANGQAQTQRKTCDAKIKEHLNKEKQLYKSMFSATAAAKGDLNEAVKTENGAAL